MLETKNTVLDADRDFAEAVLAGLEREQKAISSAWLYDEEGSELYEQITQLPEYYVARTETGILSAQGDDIAAMLPEAATIIEYGAGAAIKTRLLLDALRAPRTYLPTDISAEFLQAASADLAALYPDIEVRPVVGHFLEDAALGDTGPSARRIGFFPGSTIGNLTDAEILRFFKLVRRHVGPDGHLLLGADQAKDTSILLPAYDDAAGVTARFNLNLLKRINRELAGDFQLSAFAHEARWNDRSSRVEMHLVSQEAQTVHVLDKAFHFQDGESIHTEISRKFRPGELETLAASAGWELKKAWTDDRGYFSVMLLQ